MPSAPMSASEVLEREYLTIRCKLLDVAASLDRLNRAEGSVDDDRRMADIRHALSVLQSPQTDRAEQIQLIFSLPYEETWRKQFAM